MALNYPNIAAIYGVGHGALVMGLVKRAHRCRRDGDRVRPADFEAVPEQEIVHHDLKPANIKVNAAVW